MKPFKLRVDWSAADDYEWQGRTYKGTHRAEIELHIMGEDPWMIHSERTPERAVGWAVAWLQGRGIKWWCDTSMHQARDHKHITLHAIGLENPQGCSPSDV